MGTVWKFAFEIEDVLRVQMPIGASVVHVGCDPSGVPCFWALVLPKAATEIRTFQLRGTGERVGDECGAHVGSFVQGPFVWHVFESVGA
jgi:hypothetical protein